jgi:hypothetical protein
MWLSPEILNWQISLGTHEEHNRKFGARSYEIWSHAEHLFSQPYNEFRISGISTLWRAIDHRLRLVERIYSLKNIPIKDKPNDYLNLLEFLGIVRPLMLQKLKEIRNAVEHEDASPPDTESCQVFLEFTWYFLRSTDGMTQRLITHLLLESADGLSGEDSEYWFDIDNGPRRNWIPKISGWVTPNLISGQPIDNWFIVKVDRSETRNELVDRLKDVESADSLNSSGRGRNPEDIFISGEIRGTGESLKNVTKLFLGVI